MNALDRLAPLAAGLIITALLIGGLVYAALRLSAALTGLAGSP